ncbi:MAG: hypothetical protein FWC41_10445, partial [Firmicutes bacterium]|nr:hypothetical protein [Bacillota bacterium]
EKVYDLQVYDNHNFFILAENEEIVDEKLILVKNCGEIGMSDNCSICILMLLNLYSFVRNKFQPDAYFDFVKFEKYTKIAQRLIDDLIDLEIEKINKILHKIKSDKFQDFIDTELELWNKTKETLIAGRRTGLGTNALADMFAALGVKYGSEESKKITDKVFKTFRNAAYESSIEMAEHLGAFPLFDYELEKDNEYLLDLYKDRPDLLERTKKFGRRNISLLTQSPSGSISIIAGTTSGCEPLFQKSYKRKKKSATDANKWEEYDVVHPKLKEFTERTGKPIEESPYNEYHEVNWKDSVDIQSIIQKYIDHSISKTINLPRDTPKETIEQVFITAWKQGCKGITVYVEGSREGILVDDKFEKWQNGVVKRPKSIPAECFSMQFKGEQFVLIVGLVKHNPYEIWIWKVDENNPIFPLKASGLNIYKEKRGKYILKWDKMHDADLGQMNISEKEIYNVELFAFTRMCSAFLRHNPNEIEVLISTVEKINDLNNIPKIICRLLKKYVKDGTKINGTECPNCKGHLIREAGCHCCKGCGYSTCM